MAGDTEISPSTVRSYYEILEDTLVGFLLPAWRKSKVRKAVSTAKFYFFDIGVTHTLAGTKLLERNSDLYGKSFEQWIAIELRALLSYRRIREELCFWRSTHGHEVDFLIGEEIAVEVKASKRVNARDTKGLKALQDEQVFKHYFLVSNDPIEKYQDEIKYVHWETFLDWIWKYNFFVSACPCGILNCEAHTLLKSLVSFGYGLDRAKICGCFLRSKQPIKGLLPGNLRISEKYSSKSPICLFSFKH